MAYNTTIDESFNYSTQRNVSVGYYDAPSTINSTYVLAESSPAYGALLYHSRVGIDSDVYSLGALSEGTYEIDVSTYTWDYSNAGYLGIKEIRLLNSFGGTVEIDYVLTYGADIAFTVEGHLTPMSATYYLQIVGNVGSYYNSLYSTQQYKASYTRTGDLTVSNNAATFSNA